MTRQRYRTLTLLAAVVLASALAAACDPDGRLAPKDGDLPGGRIAPTDRDANTARIRSASTPRGRD